ncbi:hypothetical protein Pta02_70050 [Planobispora takensis]|uniref:RDD domain-containing protein n=2 Tax=Planobispora takensis TaxID=1367882 RepID=A0A8J3T2Q7_9ACTN|nr:hypothetical protein Pta02_70050 [Planobispora takensis]
MISYGTLTPMASTPRAPTTWLLAARRHRLAAAIVDTLLCLAVTGPSSFLLTGKVVVPGERFLGRSPAAPGWSAEIAVCALGAAYFGVQHALWGQTPGKRFCQLKVVAHATGAPSGPRRAGLRDVLVPALTWAPYLGVAVAAADLLWIFVDPRRRCLHDVIAGTVVVDVHEQDEQGVNRPSFLSGMGILLAFFGTVALVSVLAAM